MPIIHLSSEEHSSHPLASLISPDDWRRYFAKGIRSELLEMMAQPTISLAADTFIQSCVFGTVKPNDLTLWIAVIICLRARYSDAFVTKPPENLLRLINTAGNFNYSIALCGAGIQPSELPKLPILTLHGYDNDVTYSEAFIVACTYGQQAIVSWIYEIVKPDERLALLRTSRDYGSYEGFTAASSNGHLNIAQWIYERLSDTERLRMIEIEDNKGFLGACRNAQLETAQWLYEVASETQRAGMLNSTDVNSRNAFRLSCYYGHLEIAQWLFVKTAPENRSALLEAGAHSNRKHCQAHQYAAFRDACTNGNLQTVLWLFEIVSPEQQQSIVADCSNPLRNDAFIQACENGHLETAKWLYDFFLPEQQSAFIRFEECRIFRTACQKADRQTAEWIYQLANLEQRSAMLKAGDRQSTYAGFRSACKNGDIAFAQSLYELISPDERSFMLNSAGSYTSYCHFEVVCQHSNLTMIKWLYELATPKERSEMLSIKIHRAFVRACSNGNLETATWFYEVASPEQRYEIFQPIVSDDGDYSRGVSAFTAACRGSGNLQLLQWLHPLLPYEQRLLVLTEAFDATFQYRSNIANWLLLLSPDVLSHAESHDSDYKYANIVRPFVENYIASIQARRQEHEQANPDLVFDLNDDQDTAFAFYCLRNLIRRNDPAFDIQIQELLVLPRLRAIIHRNPAYALNAQDQLNNAEQYNDFDEEQRPEQNIYDEDDIFEEEQYSDEYSTDNELLRLALRLNNRSAATSLMTLEAVRNQAIADNYYEDEQRVYGGGTLADIARNNESSMRALNHAEKQIVDEVKSHYESDVLAGGGVDIIFNQFKEYLHQQYELNPAYMCINDVQIPLPFDYEEFQAFLAANEFTPEQITTAEQTYSAHIPHTVYRYLSKPNHWIHANASYVEINHARTERWSTFEEYKPTIVFFWMAAKDENIPDCDGYTRERRIELFIQELALIARAHNWDNSRFKENASGELTQEKEHYDDLEGDKPSCYSGVNRRLFQSVLGHPLFTRLTGETLELELTDFVRKSVLERIETLGSNRAENAALLINELDDYCVIGLLNEEEPPELLMRMNISSVDVDAFKNMLRKKWSVELPTPMEKQIERELLLPEGQALVVAFSGRGNLLSLLKNVATAPTRTTTRHRFFDPTASGGASNEAGPADDYCESPAASGGASNEAGPADDYCESPATRGRTPD